MRINEPFAEDRQSEKILYKPKYFIISEGQKTEPKYFSNLNKSIISQNVIIINILRDYSTLGNSNPKSLIMLLSEFLKNKGRTITVLELKNKIKNWSHENKGKIDLAHSLFTLDNIYHSDNYVIKYDELDRLFIELFKGYIYEDIVQNFKLYFLNQDYTFSENTDYVNLVIDRDRDSFTEDQYDEVLKFCQSNNVQLYISNPCFEFWLFLHFEAINKEERKDLLENKKINSSKRYLEKRLHDICKYTKTNFSFNKFEPNIKEAIIREKNYEENIFSLKSNLGTNVGILVEKMINIK
jgi:hypothetical protein